MSSGTMAQRYRSFREFYPYYLGEHSNRTCRRLHFVGTSLAVLQWAAALVAGAPWLVLSGLVTGYGFAWLGHFAFEKNRPATFTYPRWSLMADFVMWGKIVRGEMDAEVERVLAARAKAGAPPEAAAQDSPAAGDVLVN